MVTIHVSTQFEVRRHYKMKIYASQNFCKEEFLYSACRTSSLRTSGNKDLSITGIQLTSNFKQNYHQNCKTGHQCRDSR